MKNVKVAVIDSGISNHSSGYTAVSEFYSLIHTNQNYEIIKSKASDEEGHGTAISDIIYQQNPNIQFYIFQLKTDNGAVEYSQLCTVLDFILDRLDVDLINISAGITYLDAYESLRQTCDAIRKKGILLLAAFDNQGAISYPAEIPSVIGVDITERPLEKGEVVWVEHSCVNILVPPRFYRTVWNDGQRTVIRGTSFACAEMTGRISKYIYDESGNRNELKDILKNIVTQIDTFKPSIPVQGPAFQIKKAVIFPVNKEAHAVLRFRDMLSFELAGAYDERLSGNVGKELFGTQIQSYSQLNWEDDFDTIILSCITKLSALTKKDYVTEIVEQAKKHGKNIYTFEEIDSDYERIFYPQVTKEHVPHENYGKLRRISMPLAGIFGTSSSQGKYTISLELKRNLERLGYDVGFLATEPSGYLFHADSVYHFGYQSNIELTQEESVLLLNELVWQMDKAGHDIGITGCQSAAIHYDSSNVKYLSLGQQNFIFGTKPDFYVVCVNPQDPQAYVQRTIQYLNAADTGKVYALALYPVIAKQTMTGMPFQKKELAQDELDNYKSKLEENYRLPVYVIGDKEDMEALTNLLIQTFHGEVSSC